MKKIKNKEKILKRALIIAMMVMLFAGISKIDAKAVSNNHTHTDYIAINSSNWKTNLSKPGDYYLTENITINSRIDITSGTVNLCLNGKTISASSSYNTSLFYVENATLNIYDCVGGGTLTGGKGYAFDGGNQKGGAIYLRHSTLNMYGGTITGNKAVWGGAVFIDGSNKDSEFNMYGGTISSNTAQKGGGGIEVENNYSYLNIYAGSIINNSVTNVDGVLHKGGGVHFAAGTVNIYGTDGDVIIKDNTVGGVANNVYLRTDKKITVPSKANISSGSSIGVSSADCEGGSGSETVVNIYGTNNNNRCFFLDDTNTSSYLLVYGNSSVSIVDKSEHIHSWVQGEVTAPSINNVGITHYTCATCGSTKEDKTYLNINDEKITIENVNTLTYNGQVQSQKLNVYYGGELLSEDTHYTLSGTDNTNAGNYNLIIKGKGAFEGERTLAYVIKKAPLTVTVNNEEIVYGQAVPTYTVTYGGFENDETKDVLAGELVFNCDYAQYLNAGNYDIIASGYESDNYEIIYINGNIKVNPKVVGLVWGSLLFIYNGNEQLPTATVTGLLNGDTCTVTVTGAKTNAGVYIATAENLSNDNYILPDNATVEFVIQKVCEADEVTSDDKGVIEEALEIIEDLLSDDNLTDEERKEIEQQKADLELKLESITEAEERMETVDETVNALPKADEVTSEDKKTIEETLGVIEQLLAEENVGNLTAEEKAAVEAQKAALTEKLDVIQNVEDVLVGVQDAKEDIPSNDVITTESKDEVLKLFDTITNLQDNYPDNLTEEQVELIEKLKEELWQKQEKIQEIEKALNKVEDESVAQPDYNDITSDNKEDIKDIITYIENMLKDYKDNLSVEEKEALEEREKDLLEKVAFIEKIEKYEPVSEDFENITEPEINDNNGNLKNDSNELLEIVPLEKIEKEHVAKGESIKVYLEVSDITETITKEDKELIEDKVEECEVAVYLDITLFKQIGERKPEKIPNTNSLVKISFQVPSELVNKDSSVTRKYQIVCVHEGEVSIIDAVYDEITGEILFETDKFSTYVLIYSDADVKAPQTEDVTAIWPWILLGLGCCMVVLASKSGYMFELNKR